MTDKLRINLEEIAAGIRSDIFRVEEALNLVRLIGAHASNINEGGFGIFFGRLQLILQEQIILLISKVYENPKEYPLRSIPEVEKLLQENKASFISIESADETVFALLERLGCERSSTRGKSVTELFPKYWQNHFGSTKLARRKIDTLRNKASAHHEQVDASSLPEISYNEIRRLLEQAKLFIAFVETTYLEFAVVDYTAHDYLPTEESKTASLVMNNLLVKANIINRQKAREVVKTLFYKSSAG